MSVRNASAAALLAAVTAIALSACANQISGSFSPASSSGSSTDPSTTSESADASTTPAAATTTDTGTGSTGSGSTGNRTAGSGTTTGTGPGSTSSGTGGGSGNTGGTTARGPAVASFSASKPTCTGSAPAEVELTWKVTGADGATLAVDGLGEYGRYGAADSRTLTFPCDGNAHTYNLWPTGTQSARRTLTVTARTARPTTTSPESGTPSS